MAQSPLSAYLQSAGAVSPTIEDAATPVVKTGLDYWRSLCGHRRFPARDDLTLRGMAAVLPYVIIIRVDGDGDDYEYRYVGEAQRQAYGMPIKGLRLSHVEAATPKFGALCRSVYEQVRSTMKPFLVQDQVDVGAADGKLLFRETAWLPLGISDARVDHILMIGVQVPKTFWATPTDEIKNLADQGLAMSRQR